MRLNLTIEDRQPKTIREIEDHLGQLRAAATILAAQQADRPGADHELDALHRRISDLEQQAAESVAIESVADAVAALDILRAMIEPDGWQYSDRRDARLFEAIREGLSSLALRDRAPARSAARERREAVNTVDARDRLGRVIDALALASEATARRARPDGGMFENAADEGLERLIDDQIEVVRSVCEALQ